MSTREQHEVAPPAPEGQADEAPVVEPRARRPVILAVDDEPAVLAAVSRDLRRGFGERYRIMRAASGAEALDLLAELRRAGTQVALLVADQRMPGLSGTDYLVRARELVPEAKRVLLTAYADTEAAIPAINEVVARLLPAQAVGPARGAAVPRRRGSAHDLGGRRGARGGRRARDRPPLLQGVARPARLPRPQPRPGPLARRRARRARRGSCCTWRVSATTGCRSALLEDGSVLERPTRSSSPSVSASQRAD